MGLDLPSVTPQDAIPYLVVDVYVFDVQSVPGLSIGTQEVHITHRAIPE